MRKAMILVVLLAALAWGYGGEDEAPSGTPADPVEASAEPVEMPVQPEQTVAPVEEMPVELEEPVEPVEQMPPFDPETQP